MKKAIAAKYRAAWRRRSFVLAAILASTTGLLVAVAIGIFGASVEVQNVSRRIELLKRIFSFALPLGYWAVDVTFKAKELRQRRLYRTHSRR